MLEEQIGEIPAVWALSWGRPNPRWSAPRCVPRNSVRADAGAGGRARRDRKPSRRLLPDKRRKRGSPYKGGNVEGLLFLLDGLRGLTGSLAGLADPRAAELLLEDRE